MSGTRGKGLEHGSALVPTGGGQAAACSLPKSGFEQLEAAVVMMHWS